MALQVMPLGGQFPGNGFGQADDARLGGGIVGLTGIAHQHRRRKLMLMMLPPRLRISSGQQWRIMLKAPLRFVVHARASKSGFLHHGNQTVAGDARVVDQNDGAVPKSCLDLRATVCLDLAAKSATSH